MDNLVLYSAYLLSFVAVFFYACRYFNQPAYHLASDNAEVDKNLIEKLDPALPEYMTDSSRYNFYCFLFVTITEVIFFLLSQLLTQIVPSAFNTFQNAKAMTPIIAASVIVGITQLNKLDRLNRLKWVKPFIDLFKENLHLTARIPKRARQIYSSLLSKDLDPQSAKVQEIIDLTLNNPRYQVSDAHGSNYRPDLNPGDFTHNRISLSSKWSRLSYLITCIEMWEDDQRYDNALQQDALQWAKIRRQYRELIPEIIDYKKGICAQDKETDLNAQVELISLKTYRLISCLLFITSKNHEQPYILLQKIGFNVHPDKYFSVSLNAIIKVGGSILLAIVLGTAVSGGLSLLFGEFPWIPDPGNINANRISIRIIYALPMHLVPVIIILLMKKILLEMDYWPLVRGINKNAEGQETPWGIYFIATAGGYLAAAGVLILVSIFVRGKPLNQELINHAFVFSLATIVTGFFVCYRLDTPTLEKPENKLLTLGGAVLQGSLTMLVMLFSFADVKNQGSFSFAQLDDSIKGRLVGFMIVTFFIGASSRVKLQSQVVRQYKRTGSTEQTTVSTIDDMDKETTDIVDISQGGMALKGLSKPKNVDDVVKCQIGNQQTVQGKIVGIDANNVLHIAFEHELVAD
jgi:hypothetical protein